MLHLIYPRKVTIFLLLLPFLTQVTLSKHVTGKLNTSENWSYLDKFCFHSDNGSFSFDIEYDLNIGGPKLLIYYEADLINCRMEKTCPERGDNSRDGINEIIALKESDSRTKCDLVVSLGETSGIRCRGSRIVTRTSKQWWFVAISNYGNTSGLSLRYSLTMTNGGSFWHKHFSAEEFYILRTYLAALCIDVVLLFLSIIAFGSLNSRQLLHKSYRLYMTALIIQSIGLTFLNTHYVYYGISGMGSFDIKAIGSILLCMSYLTSVLCLLMMGRSSKIWLTLFFSIFCFSILAFFFYEQQQQQQENFDPGLEMHVHESPFGYVTMAMRCLAWIVFLDACCFNIKHTPERRSFYYPLVIFYTPWFLTSPIFNVTSNYFIDDLEREKAISLVETAVSIIGHMVFLIITGLNFSNTNLEKHVRSSQVMTAETEILGSKSLDIIHPANNHNSSKYADSDIFTVPGFRDGSDGITNIFYQQQQGDQTTTFIASRQIGREMRNSLQMFNPNIRSSLPSNGLKPPLPLSY